MEATMVEGDVDVENVAVLEWSLVWYAVTDDLVDACANGLREVAVIQWRRI
jgi:hypothetical protein